MVKSTEKIKLIPSGQRCDQARAYWGNSTIRKPVKLALGEMAAGFERCMYCGDSRGTDIDHFEPIARNPLRTFDWLNHLLACSTCNSHQKRDRFPVDEDGNPLLIDPTAEDPFDHLLLTLSLGEYIPLTPKGQATIDVCGLNRYELSMGRMQARNVVELAVLAWDRACQQNRSDEMQKHVRTVQEQPFADVCQSMLRQAFSPGADAVFSDSPDLLSLLRTDELQAALLR